MTNQETTTTIQNARHLIWLDLEMTGLDPNQHTILEIATVVTDGGLNCLAEGPVLAISHAPETLQKMEAWSQKTHSKSGLLERVKKSQITLSQAEEMTEAFVSRYCPSQKSPLCGNSVSHDRRFLERYMPKLFAFFHYRNIDVSTLKELVSRWYGDGKVAPHLPKKKTTHRALEDVYESIQELRFYRQHYFIPSSGQKEGKAGEGL